MRANRLNPIPIPAFSLTPYLRQHRPMVEYLLARHDYQHMHLDWRDALIWLDDPGTMAVLGWRGDSLVGLMAASQPRVGTSWLRLIVLGEGVSIQPVTRRLWSYLVPVLAEAGVRRVGALLFRRWAERSLDQLGFQYVEDVVMLSHEGGPDKVLPGAQRHDLTFRPVVESDLPAIVTVDRAAFEPIWQMDEGSLRAALGLMASFTLAEIDGKPVGYELCAMYSQSAHLARLATAPIMRGRGVGSALLRQALLRFREQGVHTMTVNTQRSNIASQRLYQGFGFDFTGYDLPVWEIIL